MPQLRLLNLEYTKLTDAGLSHLVRLSNLQEMGLCGTKVTDAGLTHLQGVDRTPFADS